MPTDSVSNSHHQDEPNLNVRIAYRYVAAFMLMVATADSLVVFILSVAALEGIYRWYPQFVAQQWFIYDQLFTVFSFIGLASGISAIILTLSRRSYAGSVASATVCTLSCASVLVVSLIQPLAVLWQSMLYYLLPLFAASLTGTILTYLQKR
jgi:hypothetical protein